MTTQSPMLRLRTLGGLSLVAEGRAFTGAVTQRRPLALLAVLAIAGSPGVSRERLQALLWPESDEERARRVLAQTVYALRRDLGDPAAIQGTAQLSLNPAVLGADVAEFERAVQSGDLERAAVLYTGPFLDGVHVADAPEFERWAESERARLAQQAHQALERLASASAARGDPEVAAGWWRRLAVLDPLNGRVAAGLMEALAASGDAAGALRHARVHEALLREELAAPPDPRVVALATRLRTPPQSMPRITGNGATPPTVARPSSPPLLPGARNSHPALTPVDASPATARASLPPTDEMPSPAGTPSAAEAPAPALTRGEPESASAVTAPTTPAAPAARSGSRRRVLVSLAVAAALLAAVVALAGRRLRTTSLDPTVIVVVPFDAADPALGVWREGMVDVLSRNLDGAGPLRTIAPTTVVRNWSGRADRETVTEFARELGAGTAIYGGLVRAGADSVHATVTLLDGRSGRPVLEVRRREAVARIDRLADSLTVALVRGLAQTAPISAAQPASLGAGTPIEALRPFLRGEQFYRRAAWDSAVAHYERATALDSTFALAYRRLGLVASWQRLQSDSLVAAYLLRAGALNRRLGPRDSLLIAADSQSAAATVAATDAAAWPHVRRLFATLAETVRRYPNDPEVWFALGEARYHFGFGPVVGVPERETLAAFDRVIRLDSGFAPAYIHAVELGFNTGGAPLGLRYARAYLALNPTEPAHRGVLLLEPLLDPNRAGSRETATLLDTVPASALVSARTILRRWPDSAETAVRLSRLLATGRPSAYPLFADTGFMRRRLAEQLAFRGQLREAATVLGARDVPLFAELALLGTVRPDTAEATFARWLATDSPLTRLALAWWSARRDTASIRTFARRAAARAADAEHAALARYDAAAAGAHLALATSDSARALELFRALPDTLCAPCYLDRLVRARLLGARGLDVEAVATLSEPLPAFLTPIEVVFARERAEATARLGTRDDAALAFVRAAWRNGDPALSPAREGVARRP